MATSPRLTARPRADMVPNPVVSRTCSAESMGNSSANTPEWRLSQASKKAGRCIDTNMTPYLTVIIIDTLTALLA